MQRRLRVVPWGCAIWLRRRPGSCECNTAIDFRQTIAFRSVAARGLIYQRLFRCRTITARMCGFPRRPRCGRHAGAGGAWPRPRARDRPRTAQACHGADTQRATHGAGRAAHATRTGGMRARSGEAPAIASKRGARGACDPRHAATVRRTECGRAASRPHDRMAAGGDAPPTRGRRTISRRAGRAGRPGSARRPPSRWPTRPRPRSAPPGRSWSAAAPGCAPRSCPWRRSGTR